MAGWRLGRGCSPTASVKQHQSQLRWKAPKKGSTEGARTLSGSTTRTRLTWKSKDSNRAMSMLPGSFTVPRLTPSSSSLAGTMPPFPEAARGGLTDSLALKPGSFSRFFQQAAVNLPAHACLCCAVDEQEELASQQHLMGQLQTPLRSGPSLRRRASASLRQKPGLYLGVNLEQLQHKTLLAGWFGLAKTNERTG